MFPPSKEEEVVKIILQPILDVCTGVDGGIGYMKLRLFLQSLLSSYIDELSPNHREKLISILEFSKICEMAMKK